MGHYALRHILAAVTLSLAIASPLYAASPKWETPKSERTDITVVAKQGDITVKASKGIISITTSRPVQVKVFSILGQLISEETLPAGTSQLNVGQHGVFIVKAADLTCKVAL